MGLKKYTETPTVSTIKGTMFNSLKLLGHTLDLSPKQGVKGYYSYLDREQLLNLIDDIWEDFPMHSNYEIALKTQELLAELYPMYDFRIKYHYRDDNFTAVVNEPLQIGVNTEDGTLAVQHIGVTIRTLQGAAAAADSTRRKWRILLLPTRVVIGEIRLRPDDAHADNHD
jgi:hypothetical protein